LIIVEGIVGSGKSQTTQRLTNFLRRQGERVLSFNEAAWPHPTRIITDLRNPLAPWRELTAAELASRSLRKWRRFVAEQETEPGLAILDGQLFHGDLTTLFMMEMAATEIAAYVAEVEKIIRPLNPLLIYLDIGSVDHSLPRTFAERGDQWQRRQLDWKLNSPYCRQRNYSGLAGYIRFYRDYRALCRELLGRFAGEKLVVAVRPAAWPENLARIEKFVLQRLRRGR
jgi:hypothetical protein